MPYYFGEGDPGWDETADLEAVPARHFHYLPPPDLGGQPDPVQFSDTPPAPSASAPTNPWAAPAPPKPSWLDRLLGRTPKAGPARRSIEDIRQHIAEQDASAQAQALRLLAVVTPAMREIGVPSVYCRFDGGNDEGFAWLDHAMQATGERLDGPTLAARLMATDLHARLGASGMGAPNLSAKQAIEDLVQHSIAIDGALLLLGRGFGTGPYLLYGAFTVDFDACTIVDDRKAEPIVENISITT